jgi:hypothetical protein
LALLTHALQYESETVEQGETVGNSALATVRWYDEEPVGDGHLQGQFADFKGVGGDMLNKGALTPIAGVTVGYGSDEAMFNSWGSSEDWWETVPPQETCRRRSDGRLAPLER